jgi:hypothetical protein
MPVLRIKLDKCVTLILPGYEFYLILMNYDPIVTHSSLPSSD